MTDIHGRADLLAQMFNVIDRDLSHSPAIRPIHVFLGDYIDRGPASRETIDLLIERGRTHEAIFLRGNHEAVLLDLLREPDRLTSWSQYGGLQTLASYGIRPAPHEISRAPEKTVADLAGTMPEPHWHFFHNLQSSFVCGDFFFVHAGVRPGIALEQQTEQDLLWIREDFLHSPQAFEKYIVHGHTPVMQPDIRSNRANIDTGAYATGNLTLLSIEGSSILAV